MKKLCCIVVVLILGMLVASYTLGGSAHDVVRIGPSSLSAREQALLFSFGMEDSAKLLSFTAPKETVSISVKIHRFRDGEEEIVNGGGITFDKDAENLQSVAGTIAIQLQEDDVINYFINVAGRYGFQTEENVVDFEHLVSAKMFLHDFQKLNINEEIPIALFLYDDSTELGVYSLEDFRQPGKFADIRFAQVMTVTFSDQAF